MREREADRSKRSAAGSKTATSPKGPLNYALAALVIAGIACAIVFGIRRQSAQAAQPPVSGEESSVRNLLNHYFQTWSNKDMAGYGGCFSPFAQIWYAGQPPLELGRFLETQRTALFSSHDSMHEEPLDIAVTIRNGMAHAQVHWELHEGIVVDRGYDFFTLVQSGGQWRIVALVFKSETNE
jgi:ketosteroid isomerase-like protein